jgi:hypothetical protein
MTAKITELKQVTPSEERRTNCIEILEDVLARAKSGEIDAVLVVTDRVGTDTTDFVTAGYRVPELIGNLERLKFKITAANMLGADD